MTDHGVIDVFSKTATFVNVDRIRMATFEEAELLADTFEQNFSDQIRKTVKCKGKANQPTCHVNHRAKETRIDYFIANKH